MRRGVARAVNVAAALLPVAAAAAAHWRTIGAYFFEDDFLHLYDLRNGGLVEFLLTPHGGHMYVARNVAYAVLDALFGLDARYYLGTMYLTHLLNAYLFYRVLLVQGGSVAVACLTATVWASSFGVRGVVGWFAAYGHVLAATMILLALLRLSQRARADSAALPWTELVLLVVASMSFGVGLGAAMLGWVLAWLLLPAGRRARGAAVLGAAAVLVPLLYWGTQSAYAALTQLPVPRSSPAVIWGYRTAVVELFGWLPAYGLRFLLAPPGMVISEAALQAVAVTAAVWVGTSVAILDSPLRRAVAAWLVVGAAAYATVSLGRGPLAYALGEGPQWFAQHDRFQYVGMMALAAALGLTLNAFRRTGNAGYTLALVLAGGAATVLVAQAVRAGQYSARYGGGARREVLRARAAIESEVAKASAGVACLENRPFRSIGNAQLGDFRYFPGWAALFVLLFPDDVVDGKEVRFVERDPAVRQFTAERKGHRIAGLLLSPHECAERARAARRAAAGSPPR